MILQLRETSHTGTGLVVIKSKKIRVEPFTGTADFFICAIVED